MPTRSEGLAQLLEGLGYYFGTRSRERREKKRAKKQGGREEAQPRRLAELADVLAEGTPWVREHLAQPGVAALLADYVTTPDDWVTPAGGFALPMTTGELLAGAQGRGWTAGRVLPEHVRRHGAGGLPVPGGGTTELPGGIAEKGARRERRKGRKAAKRERAQDVVSEARAAEKHEWARADAATKRATTKATAADAERQAMIRVAFAKGLREGPTPEVIEALGALGGQTQIDALQKRAELVAEQVETQELKRASEAFDYASGAFRQVGGPIPQQLAERGYAGARRLWGDDEQADERARTYYQMWTTPDEGERQLLSRQLSGTGPAFEQLQSRQRAEARVEREIDDGLIADMQSLSSAIMRISTEEGATWPEGIQPLLERYGEKVAEWEQRHRDAEADMGSGPAVGSAASSVMQGPKTTARGLQGKERQPRGTVGGGGGAPGVSGTFATSEVVEYDHRGSNPGMYIGYVVGAPKAGSNKITVRFPRQKIPGKSGYTKAVQRTLPYGVLRRTTRALPTATSAAASKGRTPGDLILGADPDAPR